MQCLKTEDMEEKTYIENSPITDGLDMRENTNVAWKHVTIGGVSGILMGAGLLYAGQVTATIKPEEAIEAEATDEAAEELLDTNASEPSLSVAQIHNDLSFGEAFVAARTEVGPGGVFIWHGGIYNTYTADEWNAMSPQEKNDFAHLVNPEINATHVSTPTDAHPDVDVISETEYPAEEMSNAEDVQVVDQQTAENFEQEGDVHIVGYASVDGHFAVGYDTTGDGQADVAIIDIDDNHQLSDADIIIDNEGNYATIGEVMDESEPNQSASFENPDVAPDMPDYVNDALMDV